MAQEPTRRHLFTFLVEVPVDPDDLDLDDVREQIGSGQADVYADEPLGWGPAGPRGPALRQ